LTAPRHIAERLFAVLASICFVVSFAAAALLPPLTELSVLLARLDEHLLPNMQYFIRTHVSEWVWRSLFLPVLQRPGWLLPLALGLVFAGLALSAASSSRVPRLPPRRN
jgi:hypothetical protein